LIRRTFEAVESQKKAKKSKSLCFSAVFEDVRTSSPPCQERDFE
jgi:hypothetical protein